MIFIERYSNTGFEPQYQSYHLKSDEYYFMSDEEYVNSLENLNEYQKHFCLLEKKRHEDFYKENYNDFKFGIWCFIKGYANNFELNHLSGNAMKYLKHNIGYINNPDDFIVYDCNLQEKFMLSNYIYKESGFYVPERMIEKIKIIK